MISVIMPPLLHSLVVDRRLLAVPTHNVVALFQEHVLCFRNKAMTLLGDHSLVLSKLH